MLLAKLFFQLLDALSVFTLGIFTLSKGRCTLFKEPLLPIVKTVGCT
ncbi:MAG TPA: hypothetical protein VL122_06915 [Nitrospirota bacterium]|nr:hypothetical protein [Nitrospirota bacterium]